MNTPSEEQLVVSIIIKALNEEAHIAQAIRSALAALEKVGGEVILADSLSSDRTVEIAAEYPIAIVRLSSQGDRSCGVGPQLGYQFAKGSFVYILDGDMELHPGFLPIALEKLNADAKLAGVAGLVEMRGGSGYELRARTRRVAQKKKPGPSPWLEQGGLYRKTALEDVGYFSNRNLHAYEERELGLRLESRGWKLERLAVPAVVHHVHEDSSLSLMRRRWKSKYVDGSGELIRSAWGQPYFWRVVTSYGKYWFFVLLILLWIFGLLTLWWSSAPLLLAALVSLMIAALMAIRKRSISDGFLGLLNFVIYAAGLIRGLLRKPRAPQEWIESTVVKVAAHGSSTKVT